MRIFHTLVCLIILKYNNIFNGAVRGITDKYDVARQFVELGLGESVVLDDYAGQSACDIQNEFIEILQRDYPHFFSPTL